MTTSPDGPLHLNLVRFVDKDARFHIKRWKADGHPVTISLTLEEMRLLPAAVAIAEEQLGIAPNSAGATSNLELAQLVGLGKVA
jgi:hypothetical protein